MPSSATAVAVLFVLAFGGCGGAETTGPPGMTSSIAERHPGDAGIEDDPDVLFVEMGEETTLAELFARWNNNSGANSVALDPTSFPSQSPGRQSIRLFTTGGTPGSGAIQTAVLYKYFPPGTASTVFARWYVKYNSTGTFHHSGPRLGGSNPPSSTQSHLLAGTRPSGSDFFALGAELSQGKSAPTARSTVDFYNYWMHQRGTSFFPGSYFGNSFINAAAVALNTDTWTCIEVQLTLNDPVSGYGGEIAMWINGVEVSRVKQGTLGTWDEDNFHPDATGAPFEGFQWRSDPNLAWNYFQLLHFVDQDPTGFVNSVNYDHLVVARKYIGPIH